MTLWLQFIFTFIANYKIKTKISEEQRRWMRTSFLWYKASRHLGDSCSDFRANNIVVSEGRAQVAQVSRRHVIEERKLLVYRCKYLTRPGDLCKRNHCCSGKAVSIIYSECVCACVCVCICVQPSVSSTPCTCAIFLSVACPALLYFSTLSHKGSIFREIKLAEHDVCFDFLHRFYLKHFSLYEE